MLPRGINFHWWMSSDSPLHEEALDSFDKTPLYSAPKNDPAQSLGNLDGSLEYIAGATNAGLLEPAQHTALSLSEITILSMRESIVLDDLVVANLVLRMRREIPKDFANADRKLRQLDKNYRASVQSSDT
jgi:hypothetical protein